MTILEFGNAADFTFDLVPMANRDVVRCHVMIVKEDNATVSLIVLNLPGAVTCGDTEEEAFSYLADAVRETVALYGDSAGIPWETDYEIPDGARTKWVLVELNG